MHILALSYLYPNSVYPNYGIFVHNRLKAVSKYHEVKVINPVPWFPGCGRLARYKDYDRIPRREIIDGLEVYHPRFFVIPRFLKSLDALTYKAVVMPLVRKIRQTYPFDLIDLHWTYPDLPTGSALKKKYGKKMLVTLRGKEAFHIGEGRIREQLIRKHLLDADAVISLSRELRDMAVAVGVDKKRSHVIRNGVDTSSFYYMDRDICREKLGLSKEEKIILSVGSLNFRKGFDRIIKAMPGLLKKYPNLKLYIVGSEGPEGDYRQELNSLVSQLSLESKVVFVGNVANHKLKYWYNAADIFCLASRGEGSPNVLTEALACGCPAVATDVGAVSEILSDSTLGFVVSNSTNGVHQGLLQAVKTKWDRRHIAQVMRIFDWDWCAKNMLSVYRYTGV